MGPRTRNIGNQNGQICKLFDDCSSAGVAGPRPDDKRSFSEPVEAVEGVITVDYVEFASIPDVDGATARPMILVNEPGTGRLFVNDMQGPIFSVSYDGETVTEYVDTNADNWGVAVNSGGRERGMQSFAFHPQFGEAGAPGFGRFYTGAT